LTAAAQLEELQDTYDAGVQPTAIPVQPMATPSMIIRPGAPPSNCFGPFAGATFCN
jgi:hypothetical protein